MENRADLTINAAAGPQELALRLRQLRGRLLACGYAEFVKVCGQRVGGQARVRVWGLTLPRKAPYGRL